MQCGGAWLVLACVAWGARAGPGPPALRFTRALYNVSVPENCGPRTYCLPAPGEPAPAARLPAPGARLRFRIRHGDKDKFFKAEERCAADLCFLLLRTRAGHADVLNRERRDAYRLDVRASARLPDGRTLEADAAVHVRVSDENDLDPLFYPTEYEATVPEDAPPHASVVRVRAEDADLGLNGEIYYALAEPSDQFAVHPTSGLVTLTRALSPAEGARRELHVLARDRAALRSAGPAAPAARARLVVHVARVNLRAPELRARRLPELAAGVYAILEASDADEGEAGRVARVDIVDGDPDGHFRVRASAQPGEWDVVALEREAARRGYNLTLRARDAGRPPRDAYLTLPVTPPAEAPGAPVFARELYEAAVPETAPPNTPVIRLKVAEGDATRDARVHFEIVGGNEGGEFRVNPDTGVLHTARELDAEAKALYHLTVSAIDRGDVGARRQSSAKVQVTVLDANDNSPAFDAPDMSVSVPENGPVGAVLARVSARDADSGDNAYISYSLANVEPVPFDVDPFSGAVRAARLLDYESMRREWTLRVRASDWGAPYRRQAELRLAVRIEDVNDNRPQFERVECAGGLSRRAPLGSELLTLSAIDFDAGDAVLYRIAGGNDDGCFALDPATGVLSLACDPSAVRADALVLNVTATDGAHFADATTITLRLSGADAAPALHCRDTGAARRLAELLAAAERANAPADRPDDAAPARRPGNLHAPEFIDFPVEVKVNESIALGATLVRLRARDRDLGYDGLVTYGISGGDPDSAFRVDPDTGELQVIGYLDREREAEYFLNVTARDRGVPARAASRLLPVTVLDVNDNAPRFERALASFRVTENALNGTVVFLARASDADAGANARLSYALVGAGAGDFCAEPASGALSVCAPLDRERCDLYELTLRATDGGGLHAEARVRVTVDDVNDNAPRFGLASYSARVREDLPLGALVAAPEAFDPDLGAGGRISYSLPDAGADAAFSVDAASGAVRLVRALDFEERQVHGLTVRATDGGAPALWAEAALIVEVEDVDENVHAPRFAAPALLTGAVREDAAPGARALRAAAEDADPPGRDSRLAYSIVAGSGMAHFGVDDTGVIRTLMPLDRETEDHYWLTLCAQDHGLVPKHACIEVYIEVEDVNDMAPWPERALYAARVPEGAPARSPVAAVRCEDGDAAPEPPELSYAIVAGNPDGLFSIDDKTGDIVTTGRALDRSTRAEHALEVACSDGELTGTARVQVLVEDVNDHSPVFTQRYYELRAPEPPDEREAVESGDRDSGSVEWESDDEEEGSGRGSAWEQASEAEPGLHVGTVLALDADAGVNGSVRYWARARGAARGVLRVRARSGRVLARGAGLRAGTALELALRACDEGAPPRCSVARAVLRVLARGGGGPPRLAPPPPLQAAELDAPGFLLAVLQATDPDGDALYYEVVGGDPRREFHLGREDGGLLLARRLVWERQPLYTLNVSVTDGMHTVYTPVVVNVVNDGDEGGVAFSQQEYVVEVSEGAAPGLELARLAARAAAGARLLYGLHAARAPASLALFRLHELSGALLLARALDREAAREHRLTVWARDSAPRASRAFARVTVRVRDADEHAPAWGRRLALARLARGAGAGALVAALRARDADAGAGALHYSLVGGDAGGLFAVEPVLGDVRLARALPAQGPREYALQVRATGAPPADLSATLPLQVQVVDPDDAPPRFTSTDVVYEVYENEPAGAVLGTLEARGGSSPWYSLQGGAGLFALNPSAGLLATAAPLDREACAQYNLTVTALNMGGGEAQARVTVHVLDRNEFPPVLRAREYRGRLSEAAAAGALVLRADAPHEPLVLDTDDGDSPEHSQRSFEIHPPAAAALFRVEPATGALRTRRALDYERARRHEFTVRALDAGEPRLASDSSARVLVDVLDANDCPPAFERAEYEAAVLLPTAPGVLVLRLTARDPDPSPGGALNYDIIEGDEGGAFALSAQGALTVARADLRPAYRLRVRASDGRYAGTARVDVTAHAPEPTGLTFSRAEYRGSVPENSTKPATIAVLNVLGAALDEHVEFRILNPTDGFEVGLTSGAVRSTGLALDREARAEYALLLEARSGAESPRVARATLHVTVTDVNDNCPVFAGRPYAAAVLAGAEPGAVVLRVRAIDADAGDNAEVRYEMKRGHGELFRVDRRSGEITLKQTVDAHNQLYALVIAAFDGGVPACGAEAEVAVRVWGGGAAPAWARAQYALSAREDAAPGAALGPALRALSPLGRQLVYSLVDAAGAELPAGPLEVHFDTAPDGGNNPCVVVARAPLDYETCRSLDAVLRATDGVTGAYADAALTVTVLDVNDNEPEFDRDVYRASVSEAAAVGDLVLTVSAHDADQGLDGEVTYSLTALGGTGPVAEFTVEPDTGAVRVAAPLDAETHAAFHLRLTASDGGRPRLYSTAHLFITVEDANDCAPRMERALVAAHVSPEAARGTALARAAAWDGDARDAGRLRYRLHGPAARAFRLHPRTGVLTLAGPAPTTPPRSLNVSVSDGAHAAFARVKLALTAANTAPPSFPHVVHEARALENRPPPLLLTTLKAHDPDAGEYGAVTYSIPSARLRATFAVDARSGALTALTALDREERAEWEVPVRAEDGGGLPAHTVVRVRVLDANDNAPEFPLREYRAAVRADRAPHSPFLTLSARDADAGDNARLTYSVYEGEARPGERADEAGLFHVDPASGALSFARDATPFASRNVQVWVRARDGGGRATEVPVGVSVLGAGQAAPELRAPPPALFLREDAEPGTVLCDLLPPGAEGRARLRLAPARHAADLFAIDGAGRLLLAGRLDREAAAALDVGVLAEGPGSPAPATMVVTRLHVLDVNEHAPAFHSQPYVVHLAENAPPHTSVLQLMADDPDAGANGEVRYSLAPAEEGDAEADADAFAVDPFTGWVTTLRALDREARPEHRLALVAADGGSPRRTSRGTLVVRLVDYNDCPPRFERAEYSCSVREDAAPGTVAARLSLTDADAAQAPLSFFVADGDPRARFQLRASGELYVARELDRETEAAYELSVAATDGKFTAYTRVRVAVLDVNDNPPYCLRHRYRARLPEDAAPGTELLRLLTADADGAEHARVRYYLTGAHAHHFAVDKESGAVSVGAALDREAVARYRLQAHAQDRARADWECASELQLEVEDVNDNAPHFSSDTYSVTLPEDADLGTLVVKVHASDPDLGENRSVVYSWGAGGGGVFSLAPHSGVVTLHAPLDREAAAEHRAVLLAVDRGRPARTASAALRLTVADVNDNPPEFEFRAYRAAAPELLAPGAELLRVRATSRDAGLNAAVTYALVGGDERDDFALDATSGALRVARPLDYERRREYLLTVQAVDGGRPPLSDLASVNITVLDNNDNAPRFSRAEYAARVREDAAPGARVLQLLAEDADSGVNGRVTYAIARGDPAGRFALDADTGLLSLAAPLDREAVPAYSLEVRARDRGVPALEGAALVRLEVLDANDNAPRFAQAEYSAVVREDRPLGHTILQFVVTDADAAPNAAPFTFDFQAGNEMGSFRLDQDGFLRSARRFEHRLKDSYTLQVRVFDNGAPPLYSDATVRVRVAEESHYPPAVSALEVLVNSYLDEFPGGVVGRVHAADRDADDVLQYALAPASGAPAPPDGLFEVDGATGELRAAPALDAGEYRLNVTVGDGKFLASAPVRVSVALVSDEALAGAVVVRFREVGAEDFVLRHRRGFLRAVADAADAQPADVLLLSVQPSGDAEGEGEGRARRQVARDLDVAFAVRAGDSWLPAEALRRRLHAHLERLEERAQLVVEELVRATCGGCARGACSERVELLTAEAPRALSTELVSFVAPRHALRGWCAGADEEGRVLALRGDGYLEYRVERGAVQGARPLEDELLVSLRFRTRRPRGTLLACAGRVDRATLEVVDGYLQFGMELGAGPALVRAPVPVADGRWHEARLERRGASARLTVDRRSAQAQTPPPHAVLDVRPARRVLVGAQLVRHAHATAPEQVTDGFEGCISELRFGGAALPLEAGGTSGDGRVQLARRVRVRVGAACPALAPPSACSSYPCLHGGTCRELPGARAACSCLERYLGARCERDATPCAGAPCLHGGACSAAPAPPGYACACPAPLHGARCELGRHCAPGVCAHGGACEEGDSGPSCRCRGYYGPRCELDVDECAGEPCLNGATCLNEPGSFRCLCPPDKTGMNCGNPLYSDAVTAGGDGASGARALAELWSWAVAARWPLLAAGAALALLALLGALPLCLRLRARARPPPRDKLAPRTKLSNLEAVRAGARERPASCAEPPPAPLNNADTLRSYGSAGDELEGIPPDYRRNLNIDADRKPWSEQMHLHTFVDNKIYNDLKGTRSPPAPLPPGEPHLVGGYHWDCSDWCGGGGALPGISEVAGSERPDSSSGAEPAHRALPLDTDSAPDDPDLDVDLDLDLDAELDADAPHLADASSFLLRPGALPARDAGAGRRRARDPDASSLITMLEERASLLGSESARSSSSQSARVCEIEESDAEEEEEEKGGARHTAV